MARQPLDRAVLRRSGLRGHLRYVAVYLQRPGRGLRCSERDGGSGFCHETVQIYRCIRLQRQDRRAGAPERYLHRRAAHGRQGRLRHAGDERAGRGGRRTQGLLDDERQDRGHRGQKRHGPRPHRQRGMHDHGHAGRRHREPDLPRAGRGHHSPDLCHGGPARGPRHAGGRRRAQGRDPGFHPAGRGRQPARHRERQPDRRHGYAVGVLGGGVRPARHGADRLCLRHDPPGQRRQHGQRPVAGVQPAEQRGHRRVLPLHKLEPQPRDQWPLHRRGARGV